MKRKQPPAFFDGYWRDADGKRLGRVSRSEMAEVWRLWRVGADIRLGRVKP